MLTIVRKGTGKRRAVSEPKADMPVAIGVIVLGVLFFVMAFGFGTHPEASESTRTMFSAVFTLLGVVLVLSGATWRHRLARS